MENNYEYLLTQKQMLEIECMKLNTKYQTNNIYPDNIQELCDKLNYDIFEKEQTIVLKLEEKTQKLLCWSSVENDAGLEFNDETANSDSQIQIKKMPFIDLNTVAIFLNSFDDGVYGVINYFTNDDETTNADDMMTEYISNNACEFYNKPNIIKKLFTITQTHQLTKTYEYTQEVFDDNYGVVLMYEKKDENITDLNKIYMLKNGDIQYLNSNLDENDANYDPIITKIYEFGQKITLKEIIYKSAYDEQINSNAENLENIETDIESELGSEEIKLKKYDKLTNEQKCELELIDEYVDNMRNEILENREKLKQYEIYLTKIRKYKKYLDENVKLIEIKNTYVNFTFIRTLMKKIMDPTKKNLNINDILQYDFTNVFTLIKISTRLDQDEYNGLIDKYFDDNIESLVDDQMDIYDLDQKFKKHMYIFFEIVIRSYIDLYLNNKSFCLSKNLTEYLNLSMSNEPDTNSISLKRRFWNQLIESNDSKPIVINLLCVLNAKTKTMDQTLKYLKKIYETNVNYNTKAN